MKKLLCAALIVLTLGTGLHSAEKSIIRLGLLSKLNTTEEEFAQTWHRIFAPKNGSLEVIVKFYDSLTTMMMALNRMEIHEMVLPEVAAEYVLNINPELESTLTLRSKGMGLAFGFMADNSELRDKFNTALAELRDNWTLSVLESRYLNTHKNPEPVKFQRFDGAPTVRVAITGDLPPLDYITPGGTPAGFNTALLAEVGIILHVNIELMEVEAGARTAALTSGRADIVFWYEVSRNENTQPDVPDGIILSDPYYEWDKFIHIRKAAPKSSGWWDFKKGILELYFN